MGQVLHGSATTTEAVRRAIQHSQESLRALAKRYGVNPKTVAKWRKRDLGLRPADRPEGPRSTVLTVEEEAIIVAFRKHTLLPLDDCLYALQADDPASDPLVPSSVPATPRHLPAAGGRRRGLAQEESSSLSDRLFPYRHRRGAHRAKASSISSSRSTERRSSLSSSCMNEPTRAPPRTFCDALIDAVPYKIHTVLTDNGIHFTDRRQTWSPAEIKADARRRDSPSARTPSNTPAPATISIIA